MFSFSRPATVPSASEALPDRTEEMVVSNIHHVSGNPLKPPFPNHLETAVFGMGCFWGAERKFWQTEGVYTTAVGYAGGSTKNATYQDACSGMSGHAEVVLVVFDPQIVSYESLLSLFWETHNPTQGMRQGNDQGTQYRSVIYTYSDEQLNLAKASKNQYEEKLVGSGFSQITTEIQAAPEFFYAEENHQQYLSKNPGGYCGLNGTGISCD